MHITRRNIIKQLFAIPTLCATSNSAYKTHALAHNGLFADQILALNSKNKQIRILYPQGSIENIRPITELFTKTTGTTFELIETSVNEINSVILNQAAQKTSNFDIALPATFGIPDLVSANALADISEFALKYETIHKFEEGLYTLGNSFRGKKYGYQTDGDAYLMFYNAKLMDDPLNQQLYSEKHGIALQVPKTWEELDLQMKFFHQPEKNQFGGCMYRVSGFIKWEWWIRMHAQGGVPFKNDMSADIASDAGITALEAMIKASKYQHPSATTNGLFANWEQYAKGNSYANIGWGGTQKYLNSSKSAIRGRMYHAPTPEVSFFNWGWSYVVSNFSDRQELAYLFCLFASLGKNSTLSVRGGGFFDPSRNEHYEDEAIKRIYGEPFLLAHKIAMKSAIPDLYIGNRTNYMAILSENLSAAFLGDISAYEALALTQIQWDDITDKIGKADQLKQWEVLKAKYPAN